MNKVIGVASGKSLHQFDFLHKKVLQAARKKDEIVRSQLFKLIHLLYPLSKPQERIYNVLPYFIRFGDQFIDRIHASLDLSNHNHQIISLGMEEGKSK